MSDYQIEQFADMVRDRRRLTAHLQVIERLVGPDTVVADIGCGPGFFALQAARRGARRVYAVDLNPAVDVVPLLATANGFGDRIEVHRDDIREVEFPEPPDLILADLRGVLPVHTDGLDVCAHLCDRVLAPGGTLETVSDTLYAALATWPRRRALADTWSGHELDLSELTRLTMAEPGRVVADTDVLASTATAWARIDYTDVTDLRRNRRAGHGPVSAITDGTVDAIMLWFGTELATGARYDTAPGPTHTTHGQWMLPFAAPLPIRDGQTIEVSVSFDRLKGGDLWRWRASGPGGVREQSTLDAVPLSPASSPILTTSTGPRHDHSTTGRRST